MYAYRKSNILRQISNHKGDVTYIEAENSVGDKKSGATMPKTPNLDGRPNSER